MTDGREPAQVAPGLQLERTVLAGDRTALAFMANGVLIIRLSAGRPWLWIAGAAVILAGAVPLALGWRGHRARAQRVVDGADLARPGLLLAVGIAAVSASALALLVAVLALTGAI